MENPDEAVDEMQQLNDVYLRFYDFLYNYSEFRQPEHGTDDDRAERDFLYRWVSLGQNHADSVAS
jgi:hypothetical protein